MSDTTNDLANIFKAYDIRGKVATELTAETITKIGRAFADWLPEAGPVVVGHDMRPDSEALANALMDGLRQQGRDCWDIGLVSSDMVYFAPGKFPELAGGAMITASHNPAEYNGIKFCREKAMPVGLDLGLSDIRDKVLADDFKPASATGGQVIQKDLMETWINHVMSFVNPDKIKRFRIGVDAGNGMVGHTFPFLSKHLPIEIVPLYFDLDGTFPNHEANPMKVETLRDLSALVVKEKLDFGIAFDGDGDRFAMIDEHGEPLTGSMTAALLSEYALKHSPGAAVVHDLRMSRSTIDFIYQLGGKAVRSKVGNTIIKSLMREHNAAFGAEITGHFMFRDNYFVDSAMLAAAIAIEVLSEADFTLSEFVTRNDTYKHLPEINLHVEDKTAALLAVGQAFNDTPGVTTDELDGLTIDLPDGWVNLRPSNTEPVMRLNAEAKTEAELQQLLDTVKTAASGK